jgi:hypothetical protein
MIGIVEDGLKGPNPRYGTRQELKAAVRSDRVHQYRPITLQLSAESQGSPPVFSGLLIWDFLICIGLSEPWNILKHYSVNKDGNEPFSLPDETLTSAAFVVSQTNINLYFVLISDLSRNMLQKLSSASSRDPH